MTLPIAISDLLHGHAVEWKRLELEMSENGSPPPVFEFDEDQSYLATGLPVHPAALMAVNNLRGTLTAQVTAQVATLGEGV